MLFVFEINEGNIPDEARDFLKNEFKLLRPNEKPSRFDAAQVVGSLIESDLKARYDKDIELRWIENEGVAAGNLAIGKRVKS